MPLDSARRSQFLIIYCHLTAGFKLLRELNLPLDECVVPELEDYYAAEEVYPRDHPQDGEAAHILAVVQLQLVGPEEHGDAYAHLRSDYKIMFYLISNYGYHAHSYEDGIGTEPGEGMAGDPLDGAHQQQNVH